MRFDNGHDANLYLSGSMIKYKEECAYVHSVNDDMKAKITMLSGGEVDKNKTVHVTSLDLSPMRLGYVFDEEHLETFYIERVPARGWRHGLTNDNCKARGRAMFRIHQLSANSLSALIKGKYVSLEDAFTKAKELRVEYPFDRALTVDYNGIVRFKTQVVGEWSGKSVNLLTSFNYLKELVEGRIHGSI